MNTAKRGFTAFIGRGNVNQRDNTDFADIATAHYKLGNSAFLELVALYYPSVKSLHTIDATMLKQIAKLAIDCNVVYSDVWDDFIETVGQGSSTRDRSAVA